MESRKEQQPKSIKIAQKLVDQIVVELQKQISNNLLQINIQQKSIQMLKKEIGANTKNQQSKIQKDQSRIQKLKQINDKRQMMLTQLKQIQKEEKAIRIQHHNSKNKYQKTQLTKQDKEKLKKLLKCQDKFEKNLIEKTRQYQIMVKKLEEEEKQIKLKMREKSSSKIQQISKKIKQLQSRQQQRKFKLKQQNKIIECLKNKKKLFEEMGDKWKKEQIDLEKNKLKEKQEMQKVKSIDFIKIKEHTKRYDEIMQRQKEQRIKKHTEANQLVKSRTKYYRSHFLDQIFQQEQENKSKEHSIQNRMRQGFQKRIQYGKNVKKNHKPVVLEKTSFRNQNKNQNSIKSLSFAQLYSKGTEYMRKANERILKNAAKTIKRQQIQKQVIGNSKYKDYLKSIRAEKQNLQNGGSVSQIQQIKTIFKNTKLSTDEKMLKASMVAKKLQKKYNSRSKNFVESINAKIQILRQLSP